MTMQLEMALGLLTTNDESKEFSSYLFIFFTVAYNKVYIYFVLSYMVKLFGIVNTTWRVLQLKVKEEREGGGRELLFFISCGRGRARFIIRIVDGHEYTFDVTNRLWE